MLPITRARAPSLPCLPMLSLLSLTAGLLAAAPARAEDYSQWGHASEIWLNTSPDGANVTGMVTHFPMLVRLDGGNFNFAQALGKGQDLRFSAATPGAGDVSVPGKTLAYQIERWDSAGAAAEIWVKADTILGNSRSQRLLMYWGKADAADSSNGGAVFDSADGFLGVWHLGQADTLARPNAVAGGAPMVPVNYDGNESVTGIIGKADSLDGAPNGDYLDLGAGYADFSAGFTYTVWAYPTSAAFFSRLLDMGNGVGVDNLVLQRRLSTDNIEFDHYNGANKGKSVTANGGVTLNEWQLFTVTVAGKTGSLYRDGALIATAAYTDTLPVIARRYNYIGKSNWPGNSFYMGKIDEPTLSRRARSADWIKLAYANQAQAQTLVSFAKPVANCLMKFDAPRDTVLPEGSPLVLPATADCAAGYAWSVVSGPGPRILDPEVKDLQIRLPRISHDTSIVYRFQAFYADSTRSRDVQVSVKEAIPDPVFSVPASLLWNGKDTLRIKPEIANLAAIKASADSGLEYHWSLTSATDMRADSSSLPDALLLSSAAGEGDLDVGVCLSNNGPWVCKTIAVSIRFPVGLKPRGRREIARTAPAFDSNGRRNGSLRVPRFHRP